MKKIIYLLAILFFMIFIFIPPLYILFYIMHAKFALSELSKKALLNSFLIAFIVVTIDIIFGLPFAWMLTKKKFKGLKFIDTLVDMPLVIPTSGLGFSVYIFWGSKYGISKLLGVEGGLLSKGFLLIVLLHIVFTFPYIVRTIGAAIEQIEAEYEVAARTLGARPFIVFRTISLPLFKSGLLLGSILCFTRSLSETGATLMVTGLYRTAPLLVLDYKKAGNLQDAALLSAMLILFAFFLLFCVKFFAVKMKFPIFKTYEFEKELHKLSVPRDFTSFIFFLVIVAIPTFYIVMFKFSGLKVLSSQFFKSLVISFQIASAVTCMNLLFGLPIAVIIAREKLGRALDDMLDIILVVPTVALGTSLALFWANFNVNEFLTLTLAHMSFTFPFVVKPIAAAISGINRDIEDAARTLGASQFKVFKTITLPLIKPSIIAGVIMGFMRSFSETGATMAIAEKVITVPIYIVNLVKAEAYEEASLASLILFAISFIFVIVLKRVKE